MCGNYRGIVAEAPQKSAPLAAGCGHLLGPDRGSGAAVIHAHQEGDKKVYPGAPRGLMATHKDQLNNDLLAFIQG